MTASASSSSKVSFDLFSKNHIERIPASSSVFRFFAYNSSQDGGCFLKEMPSLPIHLPTPQLTDNKHEHLPDILVLVDGSHA